MDDLPAEITTHIIQYCDVRDAVSMLACNQALHAYMWFEPLWRELYERDIRATDPPSVIVPVTQPYSELYRTHVEIKFVKRFLSWTYNEVYDGKMQHAHQVVERTLREFTHPASYYTNNLNKHFNALSTHVADIINDARKFKGILFTANLVVMLDELCAQRITTQLAELLMVTMYEGDQDHLLDTYCDTANTILFLQGNIAEFTCESNVIEIVLRLYVIIRILGDTLHTA